jgi:thiol-disulfide isomerase/thioredoxin
VAEGYDCAVRVGDLPDSTLISTRLADNRRLVVAAPSYLRRHGTIPGSGESPPKLGAGGTAPAPERARLVVFWASWCKVCKAEAGNIEALAEDWPVISVAMQSGERDEVAEYLEERGLTVPALVDDDGVIAQAWGVHAVPAHFVVDAAGSIRFRVAGYATKWGLAARTCRSRAAVTRARTSAEGSPAPRAASSSSLMAGTSIGMSMRSMSGPESLLR